MRFVSYFAAPVFAVTALAFACSEATAPVLANDASTGTGDGALSDTETLQTGRTAVVQTNKPIAGATVQIGSKQVTSDAEGRYSLIVPRGLPLTMKLRAEDHYQLIEQEYILDVPTHELGDSLTLRKSTASLLAAFFGDYDKARGLIAVTVVPLRGCPTEGGTVLKMEQPSGASLRYTQGGVPDSNAFLTEGEENGALFYNVTPGPATITAESPHCVQMPFPVKFQGITYTGGLITEPGESFSFMRIFLGPKPKVDGGAKDAAPADAEADASSDADVTDATAD